MQLHTRVADDLDDALAQWARAPHRGVVPRAGVEAPPRHDGDRPGG